MRQPMVRQVSMAILCFVLAGCQSLMGTRPDPVRDLHALSSIHTIYVSDLREEDDANLIERSNLVKEGIQERLTRSGRFAVVQEPSQADAVLSGLAGVERWYHGMEGYYGMEGDLDTHELGVGSFKLVDSRTKQPIWTHEYETGFLHPKQRVAERVAEQVAEQLVRDASHTSREQPNADK